MEKVISLFKSFRNNEIAYDELFGTLTQMLSEDPRFAAQAITTLDNAQQLTPIPVTDFIQLRSQMEATAETFQQQYTAATPADHEATKIFDEPAPLAGNETFTSPGSSYDPTLMAAPAVATDHPGEATATATATATEQPGAIDYADEATVIMPMPPRHEPAPPTPAARIADDEHATLVAVAPAPPQPEVTPPTTSEPRPAATSQPSPAAHRAEPASNAPAHQPVKKPPFAVFAGGVVIILSLALILWPDGDQDAETIASSQNSQQQATENSAWQSGNRAQNSVSSESSYTSPDNDVFSEPSLSPPAQDEEASQDTLATDVYSDDTTTDEDTDFFDDSNSLALDDVSSTTDNTAPAIVKDAAYFMDQIKTAISANKLTPAKEEGTATWYLVELIRYDSRGDQISDARTLISQKHLELAKKAREKNQWDTAQQHLDDALKVRLPDSYLP